MEGRVSTQGYDPAAQTGKEVHDASSEVRNAAYPGAQAKKEVNDTFSAISSAVQTAKGMGAPGEVAAKQARQAAHEAYMRAAEDRFGGGKGAGDRLFLPLPYLTPDDAAKSDGIIMSEMMDAYGPEYGAEYVAAAMASLDSSQEAACEAFTAGLDAASLKEDMEDPSAVLFDSVPDAVKDVIREGGPAAEALAASARFARFDRCAAELPGGQLLVNATGREIRVEAPGGEVVTLGSMPAPEAHAGPGPDGRMLVEGSDDGRSRVDEAWEYAKRAAANGQECAVLGTLEAAMAYPGDVSCADLSEREAGQPPLVRAEGIGCFPPEEDRAERETQQEEWKRAGALPSDVLHDYGEEDEIGEP